MTCTTLDHIYPGTSRPVPPGTPCFCGRRTWAGAPRLKAVRVGSRVRVRGEERTVVAKVRGEEAWQVAEPVGGWRTFETGELEVL